MDLSTLKYLLPRLFAGKTTQAERDQLSEWMESESADNDTNEEWVNASSNLDDDTIDEIWNNIDSKITKKRILPFRKIFSVRIAYSSLKVAAMLALIVCGLAGAYLFYNLDGDKEHDQGQLYTFQVERGQKGSLRLADGTMVYLNSDSKITFDGSYNTQKREINLEGEAFFEVAKNPNKKFIVKCNGVDVEALGTKFNVKAYPSDSTITTTLAEGKVKVSSEAESVFLLPNDVASYNIKNRRIVSSTVGDVSVADFWRKGSLVFDSEPLSSIASTIERMYGVTINIKDPKIRNIKFSGTIKNSSLSNVLYVISLTYPITYHIDEDVINIYSSAGKAQI